MVASRSDSDDGSWPASRRAGRGRRRTPDGARATTRGGGGGPPARVAAPQQIPRLVELDLEVAESLALGVVQALPDVPLAELVLLLDQRIDAFAQRVVRHQVTSRSSC